MQMALAWMALNRSSAGPGQTPPCACGPSQAKGGAGAANGKAGAGAPDTAAQHDQRPAAATPMGGAGAPQAQPGGGGAVNGHGGDGSSMKQQGGGSGSGGGEGKVKVKGGERGPGGISRSSFLAAMLEGRRGATSGGRLTDTQVSGVSCAFWGGRRGVAGGASGGTHSV